MGSLPALGMRSVGTTTQRWAKWRHKNAITVRIRSEGRCGHIIAEPLASHHTMTTALCREHHNAAHRSERPLLPLLQRAALARASLFFFLSNVSDAASVETKLREDGTWDLLETSARR